MFEVGRFYEVDGFFRIERVFIGASKQIGL